MKLLGLLMTEVKLGFNGAGLVYLMIGPWVLHFFVKFSHWVWGYKEDWYDGPLPNYGVGPLFLLAGLDVDAWCYYCGDYCDKCSDWKRHRGWT